MSWVSFRDADGTTRLKMKMRDPDTLKRAIDAERVKSGPILVLRSDFPGCLDHLPDVRAGKTTGQMIWRAKGKR